MKIRNLFITITLLLTLSASASAFSDVTDQTHYNQAIDWMTENNIINGYPDGTFKPDQCVNRVEMLKLLFEILEVDTDSYTATLFPDTYESEWYAPYVRAARARGTISGYPDGTYHPAQCVNRVEAIKMAVLEFNNGSTPTYRGESPDQRGRLIQIPQDQWFSEYMSYSIAANILGLEHITNSADYEPAGYMNRNEVAEMLYRLKILQDSGDSFYQAAFDPEPIPDNLEITGQVKDSDGTPLSNALVSAAYVLDQGDKIYRYSMPQKATDSNGKFSYTEQEIKDYVQNKIGTEPSSPLAIFLSFSHSGYMDKYLYSDKDQEYKLLNQSWDLEVTLDEIVPKESMIEGAITAHYYPGQEDCAEIGIDKMNYYYDLVGNTLGILPDENTLMHITFNTSAEQGSGDWTGGSTGIRTRCLPWTPKIERQQIEDMWDRAIPHEMGHMFISHMRNLYPYWTNEGLAEYVSKEVKNEVFVCNEEGFLPVQDLTGENLPYYQTAACFWKLLDDEYPGFIKDVLAFTQDLDDQGITLSYSYATLTKDFISEVLVPVLTNSHGLTQSQAEDYMDSLMQKFHYDEDGV